MSTGTETATTTRKATTTKKAVKKAPAKKKGVKATKKATAAKKAPAGDAQYGVERDHDLPWNEKKVAVFKALKGLKATTAETACSALKVAEKANVTARDVRHYCYHAMASGLVNVADMQGVKGYAFYLTAKGVKVDPAAELKARKASK